MKVLKFYANWCGPCKAMTRVLEGQTFTTVVEEVDIDQDNATAVKFGIRGVPTCVLVDDAGAEIRRHVGMMNVQQFREFIGE